MKKKGKEEKKKKSNSFSLRSNKQCDCDAGSLKFWNQTGNGRGTRVRYGAFFSPLFSFFPFFLLLTD
jgi:hypothetical protein